MSSPSLIFPLPPRFMCRPLSIDDIPACVRLINHSFLVHNDIDACLKLPPLQWTQILEIVVPPAVKDNKSFVIVDLEYSASGDTCPSCPSYLAETLRSDIVSLIIAHDAVVDLQWNQIQPNMAKGRAPRSALFRRLELCDSRTQLMSSRLLTETGSGTDTDTNTNPNSNSNSNSDSESETQTTKKKMKMRASDMFCPPPCAQQRGIDLHVYFMATADPYLFQNNKMTHNFSFATYLSAKVLKLAIDECYERILVESQHPATTHIWTGQTTKFGMSCIRPFARITSCVTPSELKWREFASPPPSSSPSSTPQPLPSPPPSASSSASSSSPPPPPPPSSSSSSSSSSISSSLVKWLPVSTTLFGGRAVWPDIDDDDNNNNNEQHRYEQEIIPFHAVTFQMHSIVIDLQSLKKTN